jgi:putative effector of murein hydrolase LrgA (UPF0299 family)
MATKKVESRWFYSSTGSGDLSLTIKGLLLSLVPLALGLLQSFGVPLTEAYLVELVEAISGLIAALIVAWGLIRKGMNAYKARFK